MERRVLLAVSLSFLVLVVYQSLFVKPTPRAGTRPAPTAATASPGAGTAAAPGGAPAAMAPDADATPALASTPTAAPAETTDASAVVGGGTQRDVVVESDEIRAVFTTRGAELTSWTLKRFFDDRSRPVDLVAAIAPPDQPRGFALLAEDAALTARLRSAVYRPSAEALSLGTAGGRLVFEFQDATGLTVRKQFDFRQRSHPYLLGFTAEVRQSGEDLKVAVSSGPGLGDTDRAQGGSFLSPSYYQKPQAIFFDGGKVHRVQATTFAGQSRFESAFGYVGSDDHYFLSALLPAEGGTPGAPPRNTRVDYRHLVVPTPLGPRDLVAYEARVAGGPRDLTYYLGPKKFEMLSAVSADLTRVIHFGIFAWLVVPLLRALNWVNGFVGNYGWSIVILTVLINAAMFPLRHKSVVSMRKMQDLQPQVKAIQDRYAKLKTTDPARQKMNVELMNLYREKGVNPASGCLPMLLTMPVLFAFYALLSQAIELRGAPFFGWIKDLSVHDPLYITPLLMGATMVWQQKITPSTADPTQQRIMMMMPIMFTFMFLWAPSGLVIYWFISNVWAIGQQYFTNYLIGPPRVKPAAPSRAASA
jgi:YidC/Oxa1 family membrane protein insertase